MPGRGTPLGRWAVWQTDTLNPFIPGVTSIWLGNDLRNYTANTIYPTLAYTFK